MWTDSDADYLRLAYPDATNRLVDIGEAVNKTQKAVQRKAEKLRIRRARLAQRTYTFDEHYFDRWSPTMAYILGFTLADGSIDARSNKISYCLSRKDRCVLEFIQSELLLTRAISDVEVLDKRTGKYYLRSMLTFSSKVTKESLTALGIHPRKTGTEQLPAVPQEYFGHFMRGLFDGDGTVRRCIVSITSASEMLPKQIKAMVGFGKISQFRNRSGSTQHNWYVCRHDLRSRFYDLIYDSGWRLNRKFVKYTRSINTQLYLPSSMRP